MKILYYFLFRGFVVAIALKCLSSCTRYNDPCEDTPPDPYVHHELTKEMLSKVPYSGHDTMIFFNQRGDTVYIVGRGKRQYKKEYWLNYDANCNYKEHHFDEYKQLLYQVDTTLSKTKMWNSIQINSIELNSDTAEVYSFDYGSGVSVFVSGVGMASVSYKYLEDKYYTEVVQINSQTFYARKMTYWEGAGFSFYYNHHQGIVRIISQDTIIWNRKIN